MCINSEMRSDMIKTYRHTSHKSQFIDNGRFISSSFSHLVNNLSERLKLNVNTDKMINNVKLSELKMNVATAFFNTQALKMT